jgi:hypothetical protein
MQERFGIIVLSPTQNGLKKLHQWVDAITIITSVELCSERISFTYRKETLKDRVSFYSFLLISPGIKTTSYEQRNEVDSAMI